MENIVIALITGVLAVAGAYVGNMATYRKKAREQAIKEAEREAKQAIKLDAIEKKIDEHNGYAKKFEEIGKDIAVIKTEIEFLRKERNKYDKS